MEDDPEDKGDTVRRLKTDAPRPRGDRLFRRGGKLDNLQMAAIIRGFCCGTSIADCADRSGVSLKTVRETYRALRTRLLKERFARWHPWRVVHTSDAETEKHMDDRRALLEAMAACEAKARCWSDKASAKRFSSACRQCPIRAVSPDEEFLDTAWQIVASTRFVHREVGWTDRRTGDAAKRFEERMIYANTLIRCQDETPMISEGVWDVSDEGAHTYNALLSLMIQELLDEPLS